MKTEDDIFAVENDILVINKDYCRGLTEYKVILERDRGSDGDSQGRKKIMAFKELLYVKLLGDAFTYINQGGYSEKESHNFACKDARLPNEWKPDEAVKAAIGKYKEMQEMSMPTLSAVKTTRRGLKLSETIAKTIIKNIENTIELYESKINETTTFEVIGGTGEKKQEPVNVLNETAIVNALLTQLDNLTKMATKIPQLQRGLEELEEKLSKERAGTGIGRGGRKIGNRAEPDRRN